MIKLLVAYIILFVPAGIAAQSIAACVPVAGNVFKWAAIEKKAPLTALTQFINTHPGNFSAYRDTAAYTENIDSLYKHLHVADINNDGLDDIIFEGRDTAEGGLLQIFINTGGQYVQVFENRQGVAGIEWKEKKINTLVVDDWGCCAAYLNFEKTFAVSFTKQNMPVFTLVNQTAAVFDGAAPDSLFTKPFAFAVTQKNCCIRTRPVVDSTGFGPWQTSDSMRGTGNITGWLPAGTRGNVVGKKAGSTGIEWWYVEVDEKYPVAHSAYYDNDNKFPAKKRGWVKKEDVMLLNTQAGIN